MIPLPPTLDYRPPRDDHPLSGGMILSRVAAGAGFLVLLLAIPTFVVICAIMICVSCAYEPDGFSSHPMRERAVWRGVAGAIVITAAVGIVLATRWSKRLFYYTFSRPEHANGSNPAA